jgi:diguanylate cyclase (GGDEF)-like protein
MLGRLSSELTQIEKRDGDLWLVVVITGILVSAGLLAITFPSAFLSHDSVEFNLRVSKQVFLGLLILLLLTNTYVVTRRLELRRMRQQVISTTLQSELIRLQSFTDPLTEVYNRRSLEEMAGRYISHAQRLKLPLSFMMVDVDRFRDVNTRFGHLTGDFVLTEVAGILRSAVRGCDAVVRYGGDEFLVILADASAAGARKVIERITGHLADWNRAGHLQNMSLSLSAGVAEWKNGATMQQILDEADTRMYSIKGERAVAVGAGDTSREAGA